MLKFSILSKSAVLKIGIYLICLIWIQWVCQYPASIEYYYSTGLYPYIGRLLRFSLGWLPFSIGDLIYLSLICFALYAVVRWLRNFGKQSSKWKYVGQGIAKLFSTLLFIYCLFYFLWGLNYFRLGIASQLGLKRESYTTAELKDLTIELASKASEHRRQVSLKSFEQPLSVWKEHAYISYQKTARNYAFLSYNGLSVKASIFGVLGNYLGYMGYYNPFSGEAQLNTHTPVVMLPAIHCHEIAHQLGYATEDEANFVGYLAASHSGDQRFLYSTYLDLYDYAAAELYARDSVQYLQVRAGVDTLVRNDLRAIRDYYRPYRTRIGKIVNLLYGQYLKANNQPQGIDTYSDVISLMMAYRKKYTLL